MTTLEITFRGLWLYVPDPEKRCVHALAPAPPGGGVRPDEDDLSRARDHVGIRFPGSGAPVLPMDGWALELGDEGGIDGSDDPLGPRILDVAGLAGSGMNPRLLGDEPGPGVVSRITIRAGRITKHHGQPWGLPGTEAAVENGVTWTIADLPEGPLTGSRTRLNAGSPPAPSPLPPLVPDESGTIRIAVEAGVGDARGEPGLPGFMGKG